MRSIVLSLGVAAMLSFAASVSAADSPALPVYPRCEYRVDPLGIDVVKPRLSWEMQDARRGAKQTAYQILVASTPEKLAANEGDLWDSGKIATDQSTQIVYAGQPLQSRMQCFWKVKIWDADGKATDFSKPARWSMGLLDPAQFQAKWIAFPGEMVAPESLPKIKLTLDDCPWIWTTEPGMKNAKQDAPKGVRVFRKIITIPEGRKIHEAKFAVAADDRAAIYLNGDRIGDANGFHDAAVVDVTQKLVAGPNCFGAAVTNDIKSPAGLLGKLIVDFEQGEPLVVNIDDTWKWSESKSPEGKPLDWAKVGFDDAKWAQAKQWGKMGDKPWGKVSTATSMTYACGLFRKEFKLHGDVRRATVYGSALGVYRLTINGRPVGDDFFTPDWTDYKKRVYYNAYDVTDLVRNGDNAIGGVLGAGWYAGVVGFGHKNHHYGDTPKLFAQLEVEMADGTRQIITTDESWKTVIGPYREGEFLAGETYDATREIPGWASAGLDDSAWKPVAATASIAPSQLESFCGVTVQQTGEVKPQKIMQPKPGVFIFDLGQNFAGFARLKVKGPAGTTVKLRFAEVLNPDGSIYTTNLRSARCIDSYTLKGQGEEIWQPRFTFHGFRYVEVTGYPGEPTADAITGVVLNSHVPLTGSFECSSPMINQLYQNIVRTQRSNYISVPTDCPQRDERLGWTGDAETFVRAATYNADVAAFFTKWLVDLEDGQSKEGAFPDVAPHIVASGSAVAAWADAGTICPWTIYQVYNDPRLLAKHYDAMTRWVAFCEKHSKNLLRPADGYGDWLSIKADTPKDVISTAYFAYSTRLTADAARVLGKTADAEKYDALFEKIKAAFNRAYVKDDGRIKGDTQTCYVLALAFNLLPEEKRPAAAKYLVDDITAKDTHLSTGFVGTSLLMTTLSSVNQTPVAYKLLLNDTFPSWGFSIKHGATSIWERWDGWTPEKGFQDPGMNSFAHYSFGAVAQWMFQVAAGIDTAKPGFQQLKIRPQPASGLDWVKASYHSIHGPIASHWAVKDGQLTVSVSVPANTTATIYLPTADAASVREGGQPASQSQGVHFVKTEKGESLFEVGAGQYEFTLPAAK